MSLKRSPSHSVVEEQKKAAEEVMKQRLDAVARVCPEDKRKSFQTEMKEFLSIFATYVHGSIPIVWEKIKSPPPDMIIPHADLKSKLPPDQIRTLLSKLVVLKLNGGLGTSMGCTGPKSAIEVHSGYTFLDLTVRQIEALGTEYQVSVPLVLMNSFNTDEETEKILHKYTNSPVNVKTFNQSRFPRIYKDSSEPVCTSYDGNLGEWYPPGHGDVFPAFVNSPVFQELLAQGKEYVFISNIDNLGATVDPCISLFLQIFSNMKKTENRIFFYFLFVFFFRYFESLGYQRG